MCALLETHAPFYAQLGDTMTTVLYLSVELHELYLTDSEIVFTLCEDDKRVAAVRARASDDEGP